VSSRRGPGRQALGPSGGGLHCVQASFSAHQTGTRAELALAPLRAGVRLRRPTVLGAHTSCARRIACSDVQPSSAALLGTANEASHLPAWAAQSTPVARGARTSSGVDKALDGWLRRPFALPSSAAPCGRARTRAPQALEWRSMSERNERSESSAWPRCCGPGHSNGSVPLVCTPSLRATQARAGLGRGAVSAPV